jgi:hypothetical protein
METKKLKYYNNFLATSYRWLASSLGCSSDLHLVMDIHRKYIRVLKTRGKTEAINYIKGLRSDVYKLLSLSSDGKFFIQEEIFIHKDLMFLKNKKTVFKVPFLKLLLTVLSCSRTLRLKSSPDISTITGPSKLKKYPFSSSDFDEFWVTLGYKKNGKMNTFIPNSLRFKSYHKTTKIGPNGQALYNSIDDLSLLYNEHPYVLRDIIYLGGSKLQSYIISVLHFIDPILSYLSLSPYYTNKKFNCIRRVSHFSEKEGKTRVVALFDYFSQTALRPLHNYLFKVMRKIPQDYTFNQTDFLSTIGNKDIYYSIDLTAFTDRFPVLINRDLLASRFGITYANSWMRIMTQPLLYEGELISYSVGNPMGAYSSWNSTSLSHHFLVWKSCKNLGVDWSTLPYALLGDDIVICHKEVALEYCRLIRTIGVQWNNSKTHVSPHFFEFAKRIYWNGEDITPFPLPGLYEEHKTVSGFTQILLNASSKGFGEVIDLLDSFELFLTFMGKPRRLRSKLICWGKEMLVLSNVIQGKAPALELIPFVESLSPDIINNFSEDIMYNIVSHCVMMMFTESNSKLLDVKNKEPLGVFPEMLTIFLTSLTYKESVEPSYCKIIPANYIIRDDVYEIIERLPESVPLTYVWGLISERYILSLNRALKIDTTGGDWDLVFNNLLVPKSDHEVFTSRSSPVIFKSSGRIFILIKEQIKTLLAYPQLM